ncbi:cysteine hydrolase [Xenophilus sp. AP218F]|nr:cysteine hydrolase [Xenophilus sp. AP218F]
MPNSALVIVDVQNAVVEGEPRAARLDAVLDNLNLAIAKARQRGMAVIFVQHEEDDLPRDSDGWQLHPRLRREAGDLVVAKRYGDSFCDTRLAQELATWDADAVWIGGSATDFCIDSTVRGAVARGYAVTVIADGHTTKPFAALSGEQVIDHFNWAWAASSATPRPLRVVPAAQL